jgi:glycosyltransferase involved in cell wall biosynthesis
MSSTIAIIPCHNEESSIGSTISRLQELNLDIEIWVVNNLSTDKTYEEARKCGVKVINCPQQGKGYSLRLAFSRITPDIDFVFIVDGDDTYGFENLPMALAMMQNGNYDMIVGNRISDFTALAERSDAYRKGHNFGNYILTKIFQKVFQIEIVDTLSGWRVMSSNFIRAFSGGATGFEIEAELNAHAFFLDSPVTNVDVSYQGRLIGSDSKLRTYKDGFKILRMYSRLFRTEQPLRAYTFLAAPWLILSIFLIRNVLQNYFDLHLVPNFPSLIAGVGSFTVSALLWSTGLILKNLRLARLQNARYQYTNGHSN